MTKKTNTKGGPTLTARRKQQQSVTLRGLQQPAAQGKQFPSFAAALAVADYPEPEPVIEWKGTDALAVLDVDWHDVPPCPHRPEWVMFRVVPEPAWWWVSHGGGLKLVYLPAGRLTAAELAAVARAVIRTLGLRESGIELLSRTRHPRYPRGDQQCGRVCGIGRAGDGLNKARSILLGDIDRDAASDIDPDQIDEWLSEIGFVQGQRYTHDRCPIDPSDGRDSVMVLDSGIYCHRCEAHGMCYQGLSKPGFAPFAMLLGITPPRTFNPLRAAVRGVCHWEHARHILRQVTGHEDQLAYRALLKLWHVDGQKLWRTATKRVAKAFFPSVPLVRGNGQWLEADTLQPACHSGLAERLEALPAVQYVKGKGVLGLSRSLLGEFQSGRDLSDRGYPPLVPLRGVDLAARVRPDDGKVRVVVPANPPFRYRPEGARDLAKAEHYIRQCFPTVNLNALRLLIAAKGLIQRGDLNDAPQIYLVGQSKSGKSAHARLAAELACDRVTECKFRPDVDRFYQQYAKASQQSSYAGYNEASKSGIKEEALRDCCLSFVKGSTFHKLYHGPMEIDTPAAVVMTDVLVPDVLRKDVQTGRRIALVELGAGLNADADARDWHNTCGTGSIECWRAGWGHADHADAFLSDIMDRYFRDPTWTFQAVVEYLGFDLLCKDAGDMNDDLRKFYELVMALPPHDGSSRWKGDGWRVFKDDDNSPLAKLYQELTNNGADLQAVMAAQWGNVVGVPGMTCEIRPHRRQVGVRFQAGGPAVTNS
jgi:hypothetical protein